MSCFPRFRRWLLLGAALFSTSALLAQEPPAAIDPPVAPTVSATPPPTPAPPVLRFYSPRTVLWLGRKAVIPFELNQPASTDLTYPASVADYGMIEILRPPVVLAGQSTGFLRVRALLPGRTRLLVPGHGAIDLEIKPDPAGAAEALVDPESGRPRIVSPVGQCRGLGRVRSRGGRL